MKRRICLFAFALFALAGCAMPFGRDVPQSYRFVGYVTPTADLPRFDAQKLTTINFAFARIDANGEVVLKRPEDAAYLAQLVALKARNPELKILLSIGGWGLDGFSDAALSDTSRARFADSAARVIAQHHLDGVDIDWEYPTLAGPGIVHRPEDKRDFTLLLEAVRKRFDALAREQRRASNDPDPSQHFLITAALADSEFVAGIELDRAGQLLDWINLMTYDFHGSLTPTTGHHSAFSRSTTAAADDRTVEAAVKQFVDAGVPRAKLVVGVPFYGKGFREARADNHGLDQPFTGRVPMYAWSQLSGMIDHDGYVRYWDAQAREPYLWNEAKREFVSYDDPQSLALKAEYVRTQHLGGVMYWEQTNDPDGALFTSIAQVLRPNKPGH